MLVEDFKALSPSQLAERLALADIGVELAARVQRFTELAARDQGSGGRVRETGDVRLEAKTEDGFVWCQVRSPEGSPHGWNHSVDEQGRRQRNGTCLTCWKTHASPERRRAREREVAEAIRLEQAAIAARVTRDEDDRRRFFEEMDAAATGEALPGSSGTPVAASPGPSLLGDLGDAAGMRLDRDQLEMGPPAGEPVRPSEDPRDGAASRPFHWFGTG